MKGGFGTTETTTKYRILGRWEGFVCHPCQVRHLVVRYALPLLLAAAGSEIVAYGWPFGGGGSPAEAMTVAGVVPVMMSVVGAGTKDAMHTALIQRRHMVGCLGVIGWLAGMAVWAAGTFGALFPLVSALNLESGQNSLNDGTDVVSALPTWLIGIVGHCQLLLLATVLTVRTPVLESLAWRRSKRALCEELGYPRLFGFNGARYGQLSRPPAEQKPPSPSHR